MFALGRLLSRQHECPNLRFRFRPDTATFAETRNDFGIPGGYLPEILFAHPRLCKEGVDVGQEDRMHDGHGPDYIL